MESLIKNRSRFNQSIDFTGLKNGKIYPSDVDAIIEIDNRFLIIIETKVEGTEIPLGQRLMLERLVDSWSCKDNSKAIIFLAEHNTPLEDMINLQYCKVSKVYEESKWINSNKKLSIKEALKILADKWDVPKLK